MEERNTGGGIEGDSYEIRETGTRREMKWEKEQNRRMKELEKGNKWEERGETKENGLEEMKKKRTKEMDSRKEMKESLPKNNP